jgi:N-acetylmuramoyl-L-alanine amidase
VSYTSDDWQTLAQTIFGESRGQPLQGQIAIGWVVMNRAAKPGWWGGPDVTSVCRKPFQFSCWNSDDPNLPLMQTATPKDPNFLMALGVAALVLTRQLPDPTGGATNYFADYIPAPDWAETMVPTVKIGPHQFFKEA